ncbi:hypothetical protein [cf. Phormidesmis sp. LEGE 11477]|uniref:hypothetical protein n=1 Tax=cf. Phormidesmis sp. LEGE 11477 TaxID=1828680 RepID=UPI0018824DD9|nr:hypothetical protein [cf. Phormidesmis sp. LEGE 11477]MBE9063430.1 hypothetical protein [cf. Phormidesmis sp. LEGE 11477]
MYTVQILEWPHPVIDEDWAAGRLQWREITPLAYRELKAVCPLREEQADAFMQSELVDVLGNGDGLYVCCKRENGSCFARLLPGSDWWKRDYVPLPEVSRLA